MQVRTCRMTIKCGREEGPGPRPNDTREDRGQGTSTRSGAPPPQRPAEKPQKGSKVNIQETRTTHRNTLVMCSIGSILMIVYPSIRGSGIEHIFPKSMVMLTLPSDSDHKFMLEGRHNLAIHNPLRKSVVDMDHSKDRPVE